MKFGMWTTIWQKTTYNELFLDWLPLLKPLPKPLVVVASEAFAAEGAKGLIIINRTLRFFPYVESHLYWYTFATMQMHLRPYCYTKESQNFYNASATGQIIGQKSSELAKIWVMPLQCCKCIWLRNRKFTNAVDTLWIHEKAITRIFTIPLWRHRF